VYRYNICNIRCRRIQCPSVITGTDTTRLYLQLGLVRTQIPDTTTAVASTSSSTACKYIRSLANGEEWTVLVLMLLFLIFFYFGKIWSKHLSYSMLLQLIGKKDAFSSLTLISWKQCLWYVGNASKYQYTVSNAKWPYGIWSRQEIFVYLYMFLRLVSLHQAKIAFASAKEVWGTSCLGTPIANNVDKKETSILLLPTISLFHHHFQHTTTQH